MSNKEKANTPPVLTEAEKIWNEIKDKEINMFSLPYRKVSDFCQPSLVDPSRCFLLFRASAVLPSLEATLGDAFECTAADKYIIVARKAK